MANKTTLLRAEQLQSRQSVAAFLRELAESLDAGEVTLRRGDEEVTFSLPELVELEIELTEKEKGQKSEWELEIEIEWTDEQTQGSVTVA